MLFLRGASRLRARGLYTFRHRFLFDEIYPGVLPNVLPDFCNPVKEFFYVFSRAPLLLDVLFVTIRRVKKTLPIVIPTLVFQARPRFLPE